MGNHDRIELILEYAKSTVTDIRIVPFSLDVEVLEEEEKTDAYKRLRKVH
jgi:hypothetical protein